MEKNIGVFVFIKTNRLFFMEELLNNKVLRQGWGFREDQNLRNLTSTDIVDKRNLKMLDVRKDDLVFIPKLFNTETVTLAKALKDWNVGYKYSISKETGETGDCDFGHMFPAQFLFNIELSCVSNSLKKKLYVPPRFWEIKGCTNEIETLIKTNMYGTNI